ncbi:hypothetical protein HDU86_005816 [Geranomyces michiganensis]|nr:hypothetical protein HDU86_005816 [Geranomyces michiganensis]
MFYLTRESLPIFLPLGFIGVYRWFWFFVKILAYVLYKPRKPRRHPRYTPSRDVTILVPTIDSGDEIRLAVRTWLKCDPYEIIFVTTPVARAALESLAREVDPLYQKIRVVTIAKPNKRNQMVAGINHVRTAITVFCDDDVLWPETMLQWMLAPFEDKLMGGVGTSQKVLAIHKRMTIWEILAAFRISLRNIEITATTYIDGGVCCLSGRTAAYRSCMLRDPDFQWAFTHEYWRGKYHQHSGDDKFLTRWCHSHNWRTYIQACPEAELSSTFKDNWRFLKQLLRWTRNTWRSDFRSLFTERYVWHRHPFVAFTMLDKFFNPITLLAGPATVIWVLCRTPTQGALAHWVIATSYIVWLVITRLIKYMPHFVRRPQDVAFIPVWLVFNIYFAVMKVYCLFTLHVTDWGTRDGADASKGDKDDVDIFRPKWNEDWRGKVGAAAEEPLTHTVITVPGGDDDDDDDDDNDTAPAQPVAAHTPRSSRPKQKNRPSHDDIIITNTKNSKPWLNDSSFSSTDSSSSSGTGGRGGNHSINLSIMTDYSPTTLKSDNSYDSQETIAISDGMGDAGHPHDER